MWAYQKIALAGALVATSVGLTGAVSTADETPASDFVRWNVLNGTGNKNFELFLDGEPTGDKQLYTGGLPWTLEGPPAPQLIAVGADNGQPRHFGGRQRHGVASEGEGGAATDTISGNEVLRLSAGGDLGGLFTGIEDLRLQGVWQNGVAAVITAKLGAQVVSSETFTLGLKNEIVEIDVAFGGLADTIEFSVASETPGGFGIKGFTPRAKLLIQPDVQVVTPGTPATNQVVTEEGTSTAVTVCEDTGSKCATEGIPVEQQLFVDENGIVNLTVVPLGDTAETVFLQTTLIRRFPADQLPGTLQIDFVVDDGPNDFVPITPCSALSGGLPDNDPGNDDPLDPGFVPPACLISSSIDSSAPGGPIVEINDIRIAADPWFR